MKEIYVKEKKINSESVFIIAEMSANHLHDYSRAVAIIHAAKEAGADAIKLQTYTPDTMTLNSTKEYFQIGQGTIWDGMSLYQLYEKAYTPWEWQPKLMEEAEKIGLICFSSPFDISAVEYMESMKMPMYKIASFEITDIPLIERIAKTGKPIIISTGIATIGDIDLAIDTCRRMGNDQIVILKCTSVYPSPYNEINLRTIPHMSSMFDCQIGLSDHTLGSAVAVGAVATGACVVEKHLTLSRADGGPDADFSMEPLEFKHMVEDVRIIEGAMGDMKYSLSDKQKKNRKFARSLFAIKDIKKGEMITIENIRSIRPSDGLHPMFFEEILGMRASRDIERGTPISFQLLT